MPTVSSFYGIIVRMYYDDHAPPHFHAYCGDDGAEIAIETLEVLEGRLPRRAMGLILEWASEHRTELRNNWDRIEAHLPPHRIPPLP